VPDVGIALASAPGPAFARVVVLTGARTCSASELVVNGLKPFADVVTIGGTTCGKPFGFNPVSSCGNTFSAVNFESFNAQGQGRYYNGIAATCPVADDFSGELGDAGEKLTAAALSYLATGVCPAASSLRVQPSRVEPGDRRGMMR
jgi:carboxyl-terminal processing protease